jgi:hypothetical protein
MLEEGHATQNKKHAVGGLGILLYQTYNHSTHISNTDTNQSKRNKHDKRREKQTKGT